MPLVVLSERRLWRVWYRKFSNKEESVAPSVNCIDTTRSRGKLAINEKVNRYGLAIGALPPVRVPYLRLELRDLSFFKLS